MLRIACCLLVACAHAAPPAALKIPTTPDEILARVSATYAGAVTYSDRGEGSTKTRVGWLGDVSTTAITFTTAFRRAGGFRLDYLKDNDAKRGFTISSSDNRDAVVRWYAHPLEAEKLSVALALEGASQTSGALGIGVPGMLGLSRQRALVKDLAIDGVTLEVLRGHPCWHLAGAKTGQSVEIWVDRESFLVRKIHAHSQVISADGKPLQVDQLVTYEPIANAPVADGQVAPLDLSGVNVREREPAHWIGVALAPHTMRVMRIFDGAPAGPAGIQVGDDLREVDGVRVKMLRDFQAEVARHRIGDQVLITLLRKGVTQVVSVEIAERPDFDALSKSQLLGKPAPPFMLPVIDGTTATLADVKGKVVILDFWATWCTPCEVTRPLLAVLQASHPDVAILGISDETEPAIRGHLANHPISYPLARDLDSDVARAYLAEGIPHFVLIDKAGIVRFVGLGIEGAQQLEGELTKLPR